MTKKTFDSMILIGAGGTGAILAPMLARFSVYDPSFDAPLTIVDADTYEEKNLQRQPIGRDQINMNKAEWAKRLCEAQGLTNIQTEDAYVDTEWLADKLTTATNHLIVCAVDNNPTRKATLDALEETSCDFLWLSPANADDANGEKDIKGQVLWWGRQEGNELGVNPATVYEQIKNPTGVVPRVGGCMEHAPSAPQLLPANALAAAYTMATLHDLVHGRIKPTVHGMFFNANTGNSGFAE